MVNVEGLEGFEPGLVLEVTVVVVVLGGHFPLLPAALVGLVHLHHLHRQPRSSAQAFGASGYQAVAQGIGNLYMVGSKPGQVCIHCIG